MRSAILALALLCALAFSTEAGAMQASAGWYGNWHGKYRWYDSGDNNRPAYGPSNAIPGIATRTPGTRGHFYVIGGPNRNRILTVHSEYGPSGATGRNLDINARAAEELGYGPHNFPTGGGFQMWDVGPNLQVARRRALALGARIPGLRYFGGAAAPGHAGPVPAGRGRPRLAAPVASQPDTGGADDTLAALMTALITPPRATPTPQIATPWFSTQARRYF